MVKVLVIDDDIDFLTQQNIQLKSAGHDVMTADTREDAEKAIESFKPDLVIVDLMMEEFDSGFALCHKIKKMDPSTPVIMVTAVTSETGMIFDASNPHDRSWVKADAILPKPVRFEQLKREMDRLLKRQEHGDD